MGSDRNLKTWVSDKLMALVGYSAPVVVGYVIGLTKESNSPASVVDKLVESGFSSSSETGAFGEEIFARVHGETSSLGNAAQRNDSGRGHWRKKDEDDDNAHEEERGVKGRNSPSKDDHGDGSESEEERLRDRREREQLEQNMRKRDEAARRKVPKKNLIRKEEEQAGQKTSGDIEGLRRTSRQEYLKKRARKKLVEMMDDVEDEDYLFKGVKLTEAESREASLKKRILELVVKM